MSKECITLIDNSRNQDHEAKVYPHERKSRGKTYFGWIVRGWKENGKWQRRTFADKSKAEEFARMQNINLLNEGRKMKLVTSELDDEQTRQAEQAFRDLGEYTLPDAVAFYLRHHRPSDFKIFLSDGVAIYLDHKEREGVRETTIKRLRAILKRFSEFASNPHVHTLTTPQIQAFLNSLTANDGTPAKRKTFNNYRNELASFFKWSSKKDLLTNRPWLFNEPMESIEAHSIKRVAEQRPEIAITDPETVKEIFTYLMGYKEGKLVKYFALSYFAGIRPSTDQGELVKLGEREDELINLTTGVITLPANVTKTKDKRRIKISDNLMAWLRAYEGEPIAPVNLKNDYRHVRSKFELQNDEPRHSFISYHVALHRSMGDTALQAGNSEQMVKRHYLDHCPKEDGANFFSIEPGAGEAVFGSKPDQENSHLRAV